MCSTMGTSASTQLEQEGTDEPANKRLKSSRAEIAAFPDAACELKVFRQMRAEYAHLCGRGLDDGQLLLELGQAYQNAMSIANPLGQHAATGATEEKWQCPKVRFGRTGLLMPTITCGGMRQQLTWKPKEGLTLEEIPKDNQANFQACVNRDYVILWRSLNPARIPRTDTPGRPRFDWCRAMELGINHFESAKGYGCSELQFGQALKKHERSSFLLQTKINANKCPQQENFRKDIDGCLARLQVEYLDLLAFHGLNKPGHLEHIIKPGGLLEVAEEYRKAGKVRWIGFSTHGPAKIIHEAIQTGRFDYVNLHYHFVGSYTASGTWGESVPGGHGWDHGTLACVRAAHAQDMGVFIISPNDKGGCLYKPSKVLVDACRPQGLTPIMFNDLWLWRGGDAGPGTIHTMSIGVARPSDFNEHVAAAKLLPRAEELVAPVEQRLRLLMVERLGEEWVRGWWHGLPGVYDTPTGVFFSHIVWLWNVVKAWGMYDFARERYKILEDNWKNRKVETSDEEQIEAFNGFTPGYMYRTDVTLADYIPDTCPNKAKVLEVLKEAHGWLCQEEAAAVKASQAERGWQAAYDLQADVPYPERKHLYT